MGETGATESQIEDATRSYAIANGVSEITKFSLMPFSGAINGAARHLVQPHQMIVDRADVAALVAWVERALLYASEVDSRLIREAHAGAIDDALLERVRR